MNKRYKSQKRIKPNISLKAILIWNVSLLHFSFKVKLFGRDNIRSSLETLKSIKWSTKPDTWMTWLIVSRPENRDLWENGFLINFNDVKILKEVNK